MIAVVDYKAGNLASVMKALKALGGDACSTSDPGVVRGATKILLPGVGHFQATRLLESMGLTSAIRDSIARGIPYLGICVGLQWLFAGSEESPETPGLGIFSGRCEHFPPSVKSPHVGWNSLKVRPGSRLLHGISDGAFVYYTHSYRAPVIAETIAVTEYGGEFSGAVERGAAMAVQFHPEKSGETGLKILANFLAIPDTPPGGTSGGPC